MLKVLTPEEMKEAQKLSIPAFLSEEKREKYCIDREQEQNLRTLLVGLERLLPTHKDIFDMERYGEVKTPYSDENESRNATVEKPCGTAACSVGYAPSCGIRLRPGEPWNVFSKRVFGGKNSPFNSVNNFMFSPLWSSGTLNEMEEAIARIKIVLSGNVPEGFNYKESYV